MVPRVFDKYEIIRRIAVGGMGEIFLARQVGVARFERLVILKSLLPELALDDKAVDMFLDEARVAATLNHPNIVAIFEVGMWEGMYFIAMEYISGDSISRLLLEAGRRKMWIPSQVTARIVMDTAAGLDHAHRATDLEGHPLRIVHRDISPQNIMVRDDGVTKVVDFGIARAANRITRTKTGMLRGKAGYFPPEVLKDCKPDHLSDQYSLGVVLWEMSVGRRLFQPTDNHLKQLQRIADGDIPPPQSIRESLDKGLTEITMRMLANDPAKRYRSCGAVAEGIKAYLESNADWGRGVTDTTAVSGLVQTLVGDELTSRTLDLTPSGAAELKSIFGPRQPTPSGTLSAPDVAGSSSSSWFAHRGRLIAALLVVLSIGIVATAVAVKTFIAMSGELAAPSVPAVPPADSAALSILEPSGAAVWIDGERWPDVIPTSVTGLTLGYHDIRLTRADQPTIRKQVELHSGRQVLELSATDLQPVITTANSTSPKATKRSGKKKSPSPRPLSKNKPTAAAVPPPQPRGDGFLTINSQPWTEIYIDGKPLGVTPKWKIALNPGTHTLRLVNREVGIDVTRKIQVKSGAAAKLKYPW